MLLHQLPPAPPFQGTISQHLGLLWCRAAAGRSVIHQRGNSMGYIDLFLGGNRRRISRISLST